MAATTTEYGKPMILYSDKASVFRVNNKHATTGLGDTQFARAMRCLNITPLCAETSQAKGRVERAHLTLQDRLVKELRLKGICTIEAANAFAEEYMADYNRRFAKEPLHDFNAYRPLALDDDLDAEFTWREPRRVSKNLTVQYDKMLYLIEDNEYSRRAIGKYIDVWHYPDGHKELRLNGVLLPYSTYDRLSEVEPVAIVDNKRLGHVLDVARQVQRKRDNNRSPGVVTRADNQRIDADISLRERRSRNIRIENERTAIHGQSTNGLLSHVYRCGIFTVRLQHRVSKRSGVVAFQREGTIFQLGNTGEFSPCCMGKAKHLVGG